VCARRPPSPATAPRIAHACACGYVHTAAQVTDLNNAVRATSTLALAFESNADLDPDRLGEYFLVLGSKGRPVSMEASAALHIQV
jgi:hypothetical protein